MKRVKDSVVGSGLGIHSGEMNIMPFPAQVRFQEGNSDRKN